MSSNTIQSALGKDEPIIVKQFVVRITSRFQEKSVFSCLLVHGWWFQNLIELQDVIQEQKEEICPIKLLVSPSNGTSM